jgi:hypothetical protein
MTPEQAKLAYELITNPPLGSKIATAKAFGADLTLLYESLKRTPSERAHSFSSVVRFFQGLRISENKTDLTK